MDTMVRCKAMGCWLLCLLFSLGTALGVHAQEGAEAVGFRLPAVPDELVTPEERAAYLAVHYWDHFDFADTSLMERPEITEQAFVNFLSILPYAANAPAAVDTLYRRAAVDRRMLYHFIELGDKYLYEPNSPMHNEELHILVLRALLANPALDETDKIRPRVLLEMALKNRPGDVAADFGYVDREGHAGRLSELKAPWLIVYFNNPDCDACRSVKAQLVTSPVIGRLLGQGRVKVLSVCVEGRTAAWEQAVYPDGWIDGVDEELRLLQEQTYDLKAMPTLYLLDEAKRVILKDASVRQLEAWLERYGR